MRYTKINQARLFTSGDHLDREAQHMFGLHDEVRCVLGDPQGVGPHCAHRDTRQVAQAFGKTPQRDEGALLRIGIKKFVMGKTLGQPHRLAQPIQHVELVSFRSRHLQPKTVRAQVDGGKDGLLLHYSSISRSISSTSTWRTSRPLTM
jgi:hypothetical protein